MLSLLPLYASARSSAPLIPPPPPIAAKAWLLLDFQSRQVIVTRNPDERVEPASLTKLMTAYLVFDALREKRIALGQVIPVSEKAWKAVYPEDREPWSPDAETVA